eukprot:3629255-Amphidinium_carterae.1
MLTHGRSLLRLCCHFLAQSNVNVAQFPRVLLLTLTAYDVARMYFFIVGWWLLTTASCGRYLCPAPLGPADASLVAELKKRTQNNIEYERHWGHFLQYRGT